MARVVVPLAEGFEEAEAIIIIDLLRRGSVETVAAGLDGETVTGAHGITVRCDCLFSGVSAKSLDGIVLPGGMPGTKNLLKSNLVRDRVIQLNREDKLVAAICAAPIVLHAAGVLKDRRATCYPGFEKDLIDSRFSADEVVADGNVITSRGINTAVRFALTLIAHLAGKEAAEQVKKAVLA